MKRSERYPLLLVLIALLIGAGATWSQTADDTEEEVCEICGGTGMVREVVLCETCGGTGEVECTICSGTGKVTVTCEDTCPVCEGFCHPVCEACGGSGEQSEPWYPECPSCGGTGIFEEAECPNCNGTGHGQANYGCQVCGGVGYSDENCPECDGTGTVVITEEVECSPVMTCPDCGGSGESSSRMVPCSCQAE